MQAFPIFLLASVLAAAPCVAEDVPRFHETRAQDFRPQMEDIFAKAGSRLAGAGYTKCGDASETEFPGWVQCNFNLGRNLRITAFSRSEDADAELVRLRDTEIGNIDFRYFIEPASYIIRTLDYELPESQVIELVRQLATFEFDLDRRVEVSGRRGIYSLHYNDRGSTVFDARPLSVPNDALD